jgi:hypothetical protein
VNRRVINGVMPSFNSCGCAICIAETEGAIAPEAVERAEELLRRFLTPEQIKDWEAHLGFTVLGSDRQLYRVAPGHKLPHSRLVRDDGFGTDVYPIETRIAADWALAMMFYLQDNAPNVVQTGCHAEGRRFRRVAYAEALRS